MSEEQELPEDIKEAVAHSLIPLLKKLAKENGIEINDVTEVGEPIPLEIWMLDFKRNDGTTPYTVELTQKS